ncbi:Cytochrome c oxidase assembly protein cox19 [Perkinsus olseni]|uniref:Cytochrome c oxidase assembly protein cox19 n=1 Tax=Perkinsus olseni TaxID=32597 RepID=A0A7J6M0X9_PEROL|nr:Cytochrome c oxidase assembly protein cox19 [Perkinsus olseni]
MAAAVTAAPTCLADGCCCCEDIPLVRSILALHQQLMSGLILSDEGRSLLGEADEKLASLPGAPPATATAAAPRLAADSTEERLEEANGSIPPYEHQIIQAHFEEYADTAVQRDVSTNLTPRHQEMIDDGLGVHPRGIEPTPFPISDDALHERLTILEEAVAGAMLGSHDYQLAPTPAAAGSGGNIADETASGEKERLSSMREEFSEFRVRSELCMEDLANAIEENKRDIAQLHAGIEECRHLVGHSPNRIHRGSSRAETGHRSVGGVEDKLDEGNSEEQIADGEPTGREETLEETCEVGRPVGGGRGDKNSKGQLHLGDRLHSAESNWAAALSEPPATNSAMLLASELQGVAKQISDLEGIVCNLARGVARLAQVVGVFPRLQESQHDDEVDVDVELLQWQDCANNMVSSTAAASSMLSQFCTREHGSTKRRGGAMGFGRFMVTLRMVGPTCEAPHLEERCGQGEEGVHSVLWWGRPPANFSAYRMPRYVQAEQHGQCKPFEEKIAASAAEDKGSFPLDHFNQCKQIHDKYLKCLRKHKNDNRSCRFLAKEYLQCRMDHGLMAPEPMERLGFTPEDDRAHKPRDVRADTVREDKGWLAGRELLEARGWVRPRMFGGGVWGGNKLDNLFLTGPSVVQGNSDVQLRKVAGSNPTTIFSVSIYHRVPSFVFQ